MRSILVLQHATAGAEIELGVFADALRTEGVNWSVVNTAMGELVPSDLGKDHEGLIVLGGTMSVSEQDQFPYLSGEIRLLRRTLEQARPILGVCLGSQLLAATLGARVYQAPRREIGWHAVHLTPAARGDALFGDLPDSFDAFHWHGDCFDLPDGAVHLASSQSTPVQAFRFGDCAWAIQFHPEMRASGIVDWTGRFANEREEAGVAAEEIEAGTRRSLARQQEIGMEICRRWVALEGRES